MACGSTVEKSIPINIDPVRRKVLYIRITDLSTDIDIYYCKVTRCRQLVAAVEKSILYTPLMSIDQFGRKVLFEQPISIVTKCSAIHSG